MSKENNVLFIGNGINSILDGYDWNQLMKNLFKKFGTTSTLYDNDHSFPLAYEEIYLNLLKRKGIKENAIKRFIAEDVEKLKPGEVHEAIINGNFNEIITSNYDYTLQKASSYKPPLFSNESITKENTYSIFRYNTIEDKRIWHMHGEINNPKSIILGYEQYVGNLQKMRTYVTKGTSSLHKNLKLDALAKRFHTNHKIHSWIDLFFKKDIHIVGLKLDFEEIDLWWLLTYRARKKATYFSNKITNEIFYYIPKGYVVRSKAKLDFLKATDVKIKEINSGHNNNYYLSILKRV
jgi:hypothetical protein